MAAKTEEQSVADEYSSALSELTSITKTEINALTMLAEDSKDYAVQIAACIENHLKAVKPDRKLPILYLIDSICKNYPKSIYVQLFTQNIVSNFCDVFKNSAEKVRKSLHKLRMTWSDTKTFPQSKLNAIDKRVHEMDPNWPILQKVGNNVISSNKSNPSSNQQRPPIQQNNDEQNQEGTIRQLRSGQVKIKRENQKQRPPKRQKITGNNDLAVDNNLIDPQQIPQQIGQAPQITPQIGHVDLQPLINHPQLLPHQMATQPFNYGIFQPALPYQPQPMFNTQQNHPPQSAPHQPQPPIDLGPYVAQMVQQQPNFQVQPQSIQTNDQSNTKPLLPDDLDLTLNSLYGGKQCSSCSLRFCDEKKYAIHLDWHFRQNLKDGSRSTLNCRKWYYPLNLWVQFRDINDDDIPEKDPGNKVDDLIMSPSETDEIPSAKTFPEDEKNICPVCHEGFEKFYNDIEDEWRLKNARLHDDDRVYHPLCLTDMLRTS